MNALRPVMCSVWWLAGIAVALKTLKCPSAPVSSQWHPRDTVAQQFLNHRSEVLFIKEVLYIFNQDGGRAFRAGTAYLYCHQNCRLIFLRRWALVMIMPATALFSECWVSIKFMLSSQFIPTSRSTPTLKNCTLYWDSVWQWFHFAVVFYVWKFIVMWAWLWRASILKSWTWVL